MAIWRRRCASDRRSDGAVSGEIKSLLGSISPASRPFAMRMIRSEAAISSAISDEMRITAFALTGEFTNQFDDFGFAADINTRSGLIQDENIRGGRQTLCQDDFLLISTSITPRRRFRVNRLNSQEIYLLSDQAADRRSKPRYNGSIV